MTLALGLEKNAAARQFKHNMADAPGYYNMTLGYFNTLLKHLDTSADGA